MSSVQNPHLHSAPLIPLDRRYLASVGADAFLRDVPCSPTGELDVKAICIYLATGMFLGADTFFVDLKTVDPGTAVHTAEDGRVTGIDSRMKWEPDSERKIDEGECDDLIDEMNSILTDCMSSTGRDQMIGLSGGLDSRTLAGSLGEDPTVKSYSYEFQGGRSENNFGQQIATECRFDHRQYKIPKGYLWGKIEQIAGLNACYSEFTHPRQMAIADSLPGADTSLILGHWGDVIFDDFGVEENLNDQQLACWLKKRLTKASGIKLAKEIWNQHFSESFDQYLIERFESALATVRGTANDRLRGFKSLNWAHRWTSVNLSIFGANGADLVVPFYDERMIKLSWKLPREMLKGRKFQVEYIKRISPALARIPWQAFEPFNLYTYESYRSLSAIPARIGKKITRNLKKLKHGERVRQNWENQFLGAKNDECLQQWLREVPELNNIVSRALVDETYSNFQEDSRAHWHGISMLLTLSVFSKNRLRWVDES